MRRHNINYFFGMDASSGTLAATSRRIRRRGDAGLNHPITRTTSSPQRVASRGGHVRRHLAPVPRRCRRDASEQPDRQQAPERPDPEPDGDRFVAARRTTRPTASSAARSTRSASGTSHARRHRSGLHEHRDDFADRQPHRALGPRRRDRRRRSPTPLGTGSTARRLEPGLGRWLQRRAPGCRCGACSSTVERLCDLRTGHIRAGTTRSRWRPGSADRRRRDTSHLWRRRNDAYPWLRRVVRKPTPLPINMNYFLGIDSDEPPGRRLRGHGQRGEPRFASTRRHVQRVAPRRRDLRRQRWRLYLDGNWTPRAVPRRNARSRLRSSTLPRHDLNSTGRRRRLLRRHARRGPHLERRSYSGARSRPR